MTKKEALTNLRNLLQELYSTRDDAERIAEESGLNLAVIASSDKLVNFWWNILVEAHKRKKTVSLRRIVVDEWDERATEIKAAFETYESASDDNESIEQIGAPAGGGQVVNTHGGAFIGGNVNVGGEFVGRDKIVHGDEVKGDKIGGDKFSIGNISGSGIAIGRGAQANVNSHNSGATPEEFTKLLRELRSALETVRLDADEKEAVQDDLDKIDEQLTKPEPKLSLIKRALNNVQSVIESAVGVGTAAVTLSGLLQGALNMAQQLFK